MNMSIDYQKHQLLRFYKEQLFEAKSKLFEARSVKEIKFLQSRIDFLKKKIKEMEGDGR